MKKHGMIVGRIFLSFVLAVAPFTVFAQDSGSKGAAAPASKAAGHSTKSVPDVSPDTVLVRLPVENGQPLEFTLKQLMDAYKIPGLSVAVIDNYRIAWSKAFGVTEWGGSTPVTTKTLFQAGQSPSRWRLPAPCGSSNRASSPSMKT